MKTTAIISLLTATTLAAPQFSWPFPFPPRPSTTTVRAPTSTTTPVSSPTPTTGTGGGNTGTYPTNANTANDVLNNVQPCRPYTVIFARGTTEQGNIGYVIGPKLQTSLRNRLGATGVAYQGVGYPAQNSGNFNGGDNGPAVMTSLAQQARRQCPQTKIVLSGYSQGGIVVHGAGGTLGGTSLAGAVIFGDPYNGQAVTGVSAGDLKEYCANSDSVCGRGGVTGVQPGQSGHTSYGTNADDAAAFIAGL